MKTNSKLRTSLIIYAMILYGLWSLLELYLKTQIGIDEFTKEVYIKLVFWLLPAIVIHFRFSDNMFVKKEEMYLLRKNCWIFVPIMLLFTIYIKNSIFRNSLIFQGLPPIKYQNLMYFPLFLPL